MSAYKPTIGIEVHAELNTRSKMFCGCKNSPHDSVPNKNTCPICLAHPGTLPVVNKSAVEKVLLVGKAIGGEVADYSEFDRKQYFYPDIPKAYQLSQYAFPFIKGGVLNGVEITRIHLEEDTARSQHTDFSRNEKISTNPDAQSNYSDSLSVGESLVDFNRAGVPLMELVTEPVIHDAKTASKFAQELQLLLRTLGVSDANMERGEMRVEANISISNDESLGTKVEVKNLNSFKIVEQAIAFEISRQSEILAKNGHIIQETRGWDEKKNRTFSQRTKEAANDYRYFPDPDIPKYKLSEISEFSPSSLNEKLPVLPLELRDKLSSLELSPEQVEILVFDSGLLSFFNLTLAAAPGSVDQNLFAKFTANYLISDINSLLLAETTLSLNSANAITFSKLIEMIMGKKITSRVAKDMLREVVFDSSDPYKLAEDKGLLQDNSLDNLTELVDKIIAENSEIVEEVKRGKDTALKYLVGQGMKETRGSANPEMLLNLLKERIGAL